jgi:SAM-dependent methyltransferase
MEYSGCNLCGSNDFVLIYSIPDHLLGHKDPLYQFVRCQKCGLVYQNPRPTIEEITKFYPDHYESYQIPQPRSWFLRNAYQYGLKKRAKFVLKHKKSGKLLDIGCGPGLFLHEMNKYGGWEPFGVEISPYAAEIARNQFGLSVFCGTLEQANFPDNYFDAITMWDVLEHLHDPSFTLKEINRILKPDGIIVIRVPNLDSLDAKFFGKYWAGWDAPRHLFVFGKKSLKALLNKCGFSAVGFSSRSGGYPTFLLSLRFWLEGIGLDTSNFIRHVVELLYHPVVRVLTAPLFFIPTLWQLGPLLVVVAQKGEALRR